MNKKELLAAVEGDIINRLDVETIQSMLASGRLDTKVIKLILDSEKKIIRETVATGEPVKYEGHGTYEAKVQSSRKTTTPNQKKVIKDSVVVPKFNPANAFKDIVASSQEAKEKFKDELFEKSLANKEIEH